jgi:hypothetical protein
MNDQMIVEIADLEVAEVSDMRSQVKHRFRVMDR